MPAVLSSSSSSGSRIKPSLGLQRAYSTAADGRLAAARSATKRVDYVTSTLLPGAVCILPNRLYWYCGSPAPPSIPSLRTTPDGTSIYYFSTDRELVYDPFYADFGPLNLGQTWRYCQKLDKLLEAKTSSQSPHIIVHVCSSESAPKANAAYLVAAYSVVCLGKLPTDAWRPFEAAGVSFLPFRDATYGPCTYPLRIVDCIRGLYHAIKVGCFSYSNFDIATYEYYERVGNGDLNWIIPDKFLAFSGPTGGSKEAEYDPITGSSLNLTPHFYIPIFKKFGVTLVIRLNKKQYCRKVFTKAGIKHVDLFFLDGSCPTREIVQKFLNICEAERGAIAVHCKAGLGRTGTLIGCYAMKHYGFAPAEWIGWNRICRPGSVLGPQQHFLHEIQGDMQGLVSAIPQPIPLVIAQSAVVSRRVSGLESPMSSMEKRVAEVGDKGQANRLLQAKRVVQTPSATRAGVSRISNIQPSTVNPHLDLIKATSPTHDEKCTASGSASAQSVSQQCHQAKPYHLVPQERLPQTKPHTLRYASSPRSSNNERVDGKGTTSSNDETVKNMSMTTTSSPNSSSAAPTAGPSSSSGCLTPANLVRGLSPVAHSPKSGLTSVETSRLGASAHLSPPTHVSSPTHAQSLTRSNNPLRLQRLESPSRLEPLSRLESPLKRMESPTRHEMSGRLESSLRLDSHSRVEAASRSTVEQSNNAGTPTSARNGTLMPAKLSGNVVRAVSTNGDLNGPYISSSVGGQKITSVRARPGTAAVGIDGKTYSPSLLKSWASRLNWKS